MSKVLSGSFGSHNETAMGAVPVPPEKQAIVQQESGQNSDQVLDLLKGRTILHAKPPRLEDEGQSGG